ncbi:MAG TPA: 50S ribosomal protein L11 methyltransferase [bacterium]|nr:50S ribosomal protein L11 methyltransferase [bacterium]
MYSLSMYLKMMQDKVRMAAYKAAISATVRPGDVVLDLGAGTGIMSFLALEAGANRVYAVDMSDTVDIARRVAKENGFEGRLVCLQGDSMRLILPEPVDVIISDIRGNMPLLGNNLQVLADACKRFLKSGGRLIPEKDTIYFAPVENQKAFADVQGWRETHAGTDFSSLISLAANQRSSAKIKAEDLLAPGKAMPHLTYAELKSYDIGMKTCYTVHHAGICHGLAAWFESRLCPGVEMSNAPGVDTIYGHTYFPFAQAYSVQPGDIIEVDIQVRYIGKEHIWIWNVMIEAQGQPKVEEKHSSFQGMVLSAEQFRKRGESHVPYLSEAAKIDLFILKLMEENKPLSDIARLTQLEFPANFSNWQEALTRVGDLSERYSAAPSEICSPVS